LGTFQNIAVDLGLGTLTGLKGRQRLDRLSDFERVQIQTVRQGRLSRQATGQSSLQGQVQRMLQGVQFKQSTKLTTKQARQQAQSFKFAQAFKMDLQTRQAFKFDTGVKRIFSPEVPTKQLFRDPFRPKLPKVAGGYKKATGRRRKPRLSDYMQEFNVKDLVSVVAGEDSALAKGFAKRFKGLY